MKKVLVSLLVLILLTLTGCFSNTMHGDVKYAPFTESQVIIYKDARYDSVDELAFHIYTTEDDVELGYNDTFKGYRGFFSETADNPKYIFVSRCVEDYAMAVYIRRDFDYKSKTLVLEGTDEKIIYSDAFTETDEIVNGETIISFTNPVYLYFEDCPRLKIELSVEKDGEKYYYMYGGERQKLSDELVDILRRNNIIS